MEDPKTVERIYMTNMIISNQADLIRQTIDQEEIMERKTKKEVEVAEEVGEAEIVKETEKKTKIEVLAEEVATKSLKLIRKEVEKRKRAKRIEEKGDNNYKN